MGLRRWRVVFALSTVVIWVGGTFLGSAVPASAATGPKITGFSPAGGPVGTVVTVTGSGFTGASSVTFQKVTAPFTVESDTSIKSTVPATATSGPIGVQTPGGKATSRRPPFKVTPQITGFSPTFGPAGTAVSITGNAFTSGTHVTFSGSPAAVTVNSHTQVTAMVPAGVTSGPIVVTTTGGRATSPGTFSVGGNIFDVTNYGAHGNGTGDNTSAFAAAIAAAQQTGSGSIVSVPAGTYTFSTGSPTSIQIDGTIPIVLSGAGRDTTRLVELTRRKDLLSLRSDGTTVQDLSFDTQTNTGGHGIGDGSNNTTVQRVAVSSGPLAFGIYYSGPPGAQPGNGLYDTGNVVDTVVLDDQIKSDGFSFSFQTNASISNVVHTGSRISIYGDSFVTITNYQYTPGSQGANAGWVVSSPCDHITINNFVSSGQGGQIRNAPSTARINTDITVNGERMTGSHNNRLLIGDVTNLVVENSTLDAIVISPQHTTQGTVSSTTYTSVTKKPLNKGATINVIFR